MPKLHHSCLLCALPKVMSPSGGCGSVALDGVAVSDCRTHDWREWVTSQLQSSVDVGTFAPSKLLAHFKNKLSDHK